MTAHCAVCACSCMHAASDQSARPAVDDGLLSCVLWRLCCGVQVDNPSRDYTPPSCISLLVTDLGVLTPAAVSDELIQLYV